MNSPIKLFFTALIGLHFLPVLAQETIVKNDSEEHFGILTLSGLYSIPTGANFVNGSYSLKPGLALDVRFGVFNSNILLGTELNFIDADINEISNVGNYQDTNLSYIGLKAGYQHNIDEDFRLSAFLGIGSRTYSNKDPVGNPFDFQDSATSMPIDIEVAYQFSEYFGIFTSAGYQMEWTKIKTPPEIRGQFDTADFFNLKLGMRLAL